MNEKELRELDTWIAEVALGWVTDGKVWVTDPGGTVLCFPAVEGWSPTQNPADFAYVKREIERRGWSWYISWSPRNEKGHFYFSIDSSEPPYSIIHTETAETEELAGCLVLKEAVEQHG